MSVLMAVLLLLLGQLAALTMGVEEVYIERVGHEEREGLYTCVTLQGGHDPDPSLFYSITFIFTHLGIQIGCSNDLHPEPDTTGGGIIHCSTPCNNTQQYYLTDFEIIFVGRDSSDSIVQMGSTPLLSFPSVMVSSRERGGGVVEVEWTPQSNGSYQVQLWLAEATPLPPVGATHKETSPHRGAVNHDQDSVPQAAPGVPFVQEISGKIECLEEACRYYFIDVPPSGTYASEVLLVTEEIVYSSRTTQHPLQPNWQCVNMTRVVIESLGVEPEPAVRAKTLTVKVDGEDDGEFTALVVNGRDHSKALESRPGQCLPLSSGCVVHGLETLDDPADGGPVTHLQLLLVQYDHTLSSTVSVADVLVKVTAAGQGSVTVTWQQTTTASVFTVRLLPQEGPPSPAATVYCGLTGTDCQATFSDLVNGTYLAEVSYESEVRTFVTTHFTVQDGASTNDCKLPFSTIGGACLMVETVVSGTWAEMNNFCHQVGGQLVKVDADNAFFNIVKFINDNGLYHHSYWIGATDSDTEDDFRWLDASVVKRGTPFWAYGNGVQEPSGGSNSNCVILDKYSFFYFDDVPCDALYTAICEEVF